MAVLNPHQLPDYANAYFVHWMIPDNNVWITLNRETGNYTAIYMDWNEEAEDWDETEVLSPAASLKLACQHELVRRNGRGERNDEEDEKDS